METIGSSELRSTNFGRNWTMHPSRLGGFFALGPQTSKPQILEPEPKDLRVLELRNQAPQNLNTDGTLTVQRGLGKP